MIKQKSEFKEGVGTIMTAWEIILAVVILIVSLKRVPKEDEIVLEGENKNSNNKE